MNGIWSLAKPVQQSEMLYADLVGIEGFTDEQAGKFRASQVSALKHNTPNMMIANIFAAFFMAWVGHETDNAIGIQLWAAFIIIVSGSLLISSSVKKTKIPNYVRVKTIHKAEIYAMLLGLAWGLLPATFMGSSDPNFRVVIIGVVMGASGLGALNLAQIPSAAIIYTSVVTSALAMGCMDIDTASGTATAGFGVIYGAALTIMIVAMHRASIRRAIDRENMTEQAEIIKLLLSDFEAGARDWLWEAGADNCLVYSSDRLANILGRNQDRLIGAKLFQAAGMMEDQDSWKKFNELITRRAVIDELEVPALVDGKQCWWQVSARPLFDMLGKFKGYRGVGRDVTERHKAASELIEAKEEAERASEAKSQFLAVMSHELRTPLNAILGFSDLICSHDENQVNNQTLIEYGRSVKESGQHLSNLVNGILDITRIEKGNLKLVEQEIDPAEVTEVVTRMCRNSSRDRNITILDNIEVGPIEAQGDLTRIQQILINLITNAIKFTPDGGRVDVTLSNTEDKGIEFAVTDTGIGIAQDQLKRIFEPFVQVDEGTARQFNGVGLGLAIARRLARLHGGDIKITSSPGKGTTVRFKLPAARVTRLGE